MSMFDTSSLFASLLWGSIGVGFFIYGRKQREAAPMLGGVVMVAVSYLVSSSLVMSLTSVAVIVAVYLLVRRGG
jgi:hypothetical protein